jgi:pSer/pThr/pTyr-binding forkhead associated (FHA) protein
MVDAQNSTGMLEHKGRACYGSRVLPKEEFRMKIELTSKDSQKRKIIVDQLPVIVGLDPGSDICLDDSSVGHYQCMIDDGDEGLMVWDLGTKHGTLINGIRIDKKSPLLPGDELSIGRNCFIVNYEFDGHNKPRHGDSSSTNEQKSKPSHHRQPAIP